MNQKSKTSFSWRIIESQCALFTMIQIHDSVFVLFKKKKILKTVLVFSAHSRFEGEEERGKKKKRRQHRVLRKCGSQNGIPGEVIVSASFKGLTFTEWQCKLLGQEDNGKGKESNSKLLYELWNLKGTNCSGSRQLLRHIKLSISHQKKLYFVGSNRVL